MTLGTFEKRMVFDHLPIAADASFDSLAEEHRPTCLENTRVDLLKKIRNWAQDPSSQGVFWLSGMAGTGKSTISRTLAEGFFKSGHLGASFFFKRGEADCGNLSKLFTTIAAQLVGVIPDMEQQIGAVLDKDPHIAEKAAMVQFDKLIMQPLRNIRSTNVLVLIIDALDECDGKEDVKLIIRLLSKLESTTSIKLKVFITSRPELPIRLGFRDIGNGNGNPYLSYILHEIPNNIVEQDIKVYLKYGLDNIRYDHDLEEDWPSEDEISSLAQMASPLFIVASTICGFLSNDKLDPKEMLLEVMKYRTMGLDNLNTIYRLVLDQLINGLEERHKDKILQDFQNIVGSIIILAEPLSVTALKQLLQIRIDEIKRTLKFLHSVLNIPSSETAPVRLLHLSFREFLLNSKLTPNEFHVDEKQAHNRIAKHCLQLLNGEALKQDICKLSWPGTDRLSVKSEHIESAIPSQLQYACLYWAYHIKEADMHIDDEGPVLEFFLHHFLHWLEAMSLIGRAYDSLGIIRSLNSVCKTGRCRQIEDFLQDAQRFILANMTIIKTTPLQIYSSALAFTPENSFIRRIFFKDTQIPKWISLLPKPDEDWYDCQQTLEGHGHNENLLAFSHDLTLFAIGWKKTIQLWRVEDNQRLKEFFKEFGDREDKILTLVFSHNSKVLASGSTDKTIRLWNVENGQIISTFANHQDRVLPLAFSHNSEFLASASIDKKIRLWNLKSGECKEFEGHKQNVLSIAFSHNSQLLASAALKEPARIWRADDGKCIQELDIEPANRDKKQRHKLIIFSHDSKLLSLAFTDCFIQIWRENNGKYIQTIRIDIEEVRSMAFSHNSNLLAVYSPYHIRLWHAESGKLVQKLEGHTYSVYCMRFSHDSKFLASRSADDTARIWRINSDVANDAKKTQEQDSHRLMIFSHDSKLLATANRSKDLIRLWRLEDGKCMQEINCNGQLRTLSFLGKSKYIALLFMDYSIRFWRREDDGEYREDQKLNIKVPTKNAVFSSDSELLASISSDTIRVLRVDNGECVWELQGDKGFVEFSPDLEVVALAFSNGTIQFLRVKDGKCIQEIQGFDASILPGVFSLDSKLFVFATNNKTWVCRVDDGRCFGEFYGALVLSVALSDNSKLLAFSYAPIGDRNKIVLVDVENKVLKQILSINTACIRLQFTPDNSFLLTSAGKFSVPKLLSEDTDLIPSTECQEGIWVSSDKSWIMWQQKKLLWLPLTFRPDKYFPTGSTVIGSTVILMREFGEVIIMKFDEELLNTLAANVPENNLASVVESKPNESPERRIQMKRKRSRLQGELPHGEPLKRQRRADAQFSSDATKVFGWI